MSVSQLALQHKIVFSKDFIPWLVDNEHMYETFRELADELWYSGRKHYSSRTIGEKMRFDYAVASVGDDYKLRNIFTGDLGRLYILEHPERVTLFSYHASRCGVNFRQYILSTFGQPISTVSPTLSLNPSSMGCSSAAASSGLCVP